MDMANRVVDLAHEIVEVPDSAEQPLRARWMGIAHQAQGQDVKQDGPADLNCGAEARAPAGLQPSGSQSRVPAESMLI